jgi:hypothetical protein
VGGTAWLLEHPEHIGPLASKLAGWPEGSIVIADLQVGDRVELVGFELHPPKPRAPDVYVAHGDVDWPDPWKLWEKEVDLGRVEAHGVRVSARTQGGRGEPKVGGWVLSATQLTIDGARYTAPATDKLPAVTIEGIDLAVQEVWWQPKSRQIRGHGWAEIDGMDLGAIDVTEVRAEELALTGTALELGPTLFKYGRTEAYAEGTITDLDRRAAVELNVRLVASRVEDAVEDATGRTSPLMGWLNSDVTVMAGGELPQGGARITGWVQLTEAHVFAGSSLRWIPKAFLDIAPWFTRGHKGGVRVGNLRGEATFGRGWVDLAYLERSDEKHRALQAWGGLQDGEVDVTVRAVPKRDPKKPGIGVRVTGPLGNTRMQLASRDHLLTAPH